MIMNNKDLIYESLKIIEENIKSGITVQNISEKIGFSLYYFSRLFKGITGYSPKSYMLKRKITKSVTDVLSNKKNITDIAFEYGFGTTETFSRAFQKVIGKNPSEIRKTGEVDKHKLFFPVTKEKIENTSAKLNKDPVLLEMGPLYLTGIPFYFEAGWMEDLANPWQYLHKNISVIKNRIIPEKFYQMQYWFPEQDEGSIFFFVAVEVENLKDIPVQFTGKLIPKLKFLKFLHKGHSNRVGYTYQYIYEQYFPDTDYKLPYLFNFEYYGDQYKGPFNDDSISEIYIPVERR
jgi:AraC family transcriptional regulator